jgi:hypothetical protein
MGIIITPDSIERNTRLTPIYVKVEPKAWSKSSEEAKNAPAPNIYKVIINFTQLNIVTSNFMLSNVHINSR